ncbi:MAG: SBBP repeat-containing protein, partial [Caldilineales bacterium]|nr:SBBP repeat-containing protein [Caldilineales bacterium]
DYGLGMAIDGSGNVYITGYSDFTWQGDGSANPLHAHSGSYDVVVVKLTSAGAYQWHTFYGSSSGDIGYGIAVDRSGKVYITGYSDATWQGDGGANPLHAHSGSYDVVVLKLTDAGAYQWHTFYGSSSGDIGYGIAVDGSGNVYITGESDITWQGDGGANPLHAHSGGRDIVALKLSATPFNRIFLPQVLR